MGQEEKLYVLRRPDGSIWAELMMPPSLAATINANRRKRGFFGGDWVEQDPSQYGLWHLDLKKMPKQLVDLWMKAAEESRVMTTSGDKRSVHTDALDTLGTRINAGER